MPSIVSIIVMIVGLILTLLNIIDRLYLFAKRAHEPEELQNARISALEDKVRKFETYLDMDKRRLDELEALSTMTLKCQFTLLSHAINGNDTKRLEQVQTELQEYLAHKGVRV